MSVPLDDLRRSSPMILTSDSSVFGYSYEQITAAIEAGVLRWCDDDDCPFGAHAATTNGVRVPSGVAHFVGPERWDELDEIADR